jgi:hypothetical protein
MKTIVNHGSRKIEVTIVKGKSITLNSNDGEIINVFKIGDIAEEDSFNLRYVGTIENITEKTVVIAKRYGGSKRRMKIEEFAWRNYDFDAAETAEKNAETSMYI